VSEKKRVVKKDHSLSSVKTQKQPESTQGSKEKSTWKPEIPQVRTGLFQDLQLSFASQHRSGSTEDPELTRILFVKGRNSR
jgi:hypothetical protein